MNVFRQKDTRFINLLNSFREQSFSSEDLDILNRQYTPEEKSKPGEVRLTICTTNAISNNINEQYLNALPTREFVYEASITGKYDVELYPTVKNLVLKTGAQIMMLKNDTQTANFPRWVNGSMGIVKHLSDEGIYVEIDGMTHRIEKAIWDAIEYVYDPEMKKIKPVVIGTFSQYPVKAAWAVTIHKSQGQTFDRVCIDLGNGAFAHGQTYVALSRCTSLEEITLKRPVRYSDIILDPKIAAFMKKIRCEDVIF